MTVHNDQSNEVVKMVALKSFHEGLLANVSDGQIHDIKSFLQRPVVVKTGVWTNTQTANQEINNVLIPLDVLTTSKVLSQKMSGFLGFRAKTVLRLQVNTNRFQQGRLMMTFFPNVQMALAKHAHVQSSLVFRTQLPRVEFDAACDTEVVMEIPYISTELAFNTRTGAGGVGHVGLVVYSPLVSASGELNAEYTLWAHFEDIELFYPTVPNNSIIAQSGNGRKTRRLRVGRDKDPVVTEEKAGGFLSNTLHTISRVATIASEIPLLSSVATPVAWFTSAASKAALAFGFSNPLNGAQVVMVNQQPWKHSNNCSGLDQSYNMGMFEDNRVEHLPGFAGQDVDEMALAYPLSISTWFQTVTWQDTTPALNRLVRIPLTPAHFIVNNSPFSGASRPTPVAYFAHLFSRYRGSFKLKIKIVKTEFHSGRLLVCYVPTDVSFVLDNLNSSNLSYTHREVIDIRETSEYEFVAPWASTSPYLSTDIVSGVYGYVDILVQNELRRPDTVSSSVSVLLEVSCADDFEFAIPTTPTVTPFIATTPATPQSGVTEEIIAQSGDTSTQHLAEHTQMGTQAGGIGSAKVTRDDMSSARFCVGEKIHSLRQLVKRGTKSFSYFYGTTGSNRQLIIYPYTIKPLVYYDNGTTQTMQYFRGDVEQAPDYIDWIVPCYAYFRGGMRLKFARMVDNNTSTNQLSGRIGLLIPSSLGTITAATSTTADSPMMISGIPHYLDAAGAPEIQIPYYNDRHMSAVVIDNATTTNVQPTVTRRPAVQVAVNGIVQRNGFMVYRQASEDFSTGFWTGTLNINTGSVSSLVSGDRY